jgi:hypothetical protein
MFSNIFPHNQTNGERLDNMLKEAKQAADDAGLRVIEATEAMHHARATLEYCNAKVNRLAGAVKATTLGVTPS